MTPGAGQDGQGARALIGRFVAVTLATARAVAPAMVRAHKAPQRDSWEKSDGSLVTSTDHEVERAFAEAQEAEEERT